MARATTSLPVPVSPVISTVASLSASMPIAFCASRIARELPISVVPSLCARVGRLAGAGTIWPTRAASSARPIGLMR